MKSLITNDLASSFRWHMDEDALYTLTFDQLFDPQVREHLFSRLMSEYGSPSRGHAASMTAKRIGYMAALMIYARIKYGVVVKANECRFITIEDNSKNSSWLPVYSFPINTTEPLHTTVQWISKNLYASLLVPMVEMLAKEKGISRVVLFENIFTYVKWILETVLKDHDTFQRLIDLPAEEYGMIKQHPISLYACHQGTTRKTCCLYYQTEGASKPCKSCPL